MVAVTVSDIPLDAPEGGSFHSTGVLAVPDGQGPWPGVVIVHEAFGATPTMRRQVERMAAAGYIVLMPDLFADGGVRRCLISTFRALSAGEGKPFVDIENARALLAARPECTGVVGVLGFCMGGRFALAAASTGFAAASVNYGTVPYLDAALVDACPVVGSFGGRDLSLRGAAAALESALAERGIPHDVKEYPDAGHSFLNADRSDSGGPVTRFLTARILGAGPNPEAAADAWERIDGFFAEHLAG